MLLALRADSEKPGVEHWLNIECNARLKISSQLTVYSTSLCI